MGSSVTVNQLSLLENLLSDGFSVIACRITYSYMCMCVCALCYWGCRLVRDLLRARISVKQKCENVVLFRNEIRLVNFNSFEL